MAELPPLKFLVTCEKARFLRYHDGNLWYGIDYNKRLETGDKVMDYYFLDSHIFEFPVPISDIGTATFLAEDKALLFMRYIRKHLDLLR